MAAETEPHSASPFVCVHCGIDFKTKQRMYLLKLNRNERLLRTAFCEGQSMQPYRAALEEAGYDWKHSSGALVFVHPSQYGKVMTALHEVSLRPDHVIVTESLEYLVQETMAQISSRHLMSYQGNWHVAILNQMQEYY